MRSTVNSVDVYSSLPTTVGNMKRADLKNEIIN